MQRPDAVRVHAVYPASSAPTTGATFWAGLRGEGIAMVRYWSAEAIAEVEGGAPEEWHAGFYLIADASSECHPVWWLPIDALPDPHGRGVRFITQASGGSHDAA